MVVNVCRCVTFAVGNDFIFLLGIHVGIGITADMVRINFLMPDNDESHRPWH